MLAERTSDRRRSSRTGALQALYEADVAVHRAEDALEWLNQDGHIADDALPFALELVRGVNGHSQAIDELIERFAPAWPVGQLAAVDRTILRLALYEVTFSKGVPRKAAINEAVELAKTFGGENSSKFINGVLGSLMEFLESDDHSALLGSNSEDA